eukprot:899434-Prorocentrum_minimum.AAC.1
MVLQGRWSQSKRSSRVLRVCGTITIREKPKPSGAIHREEPLISSLLATGMLDTFRIHHPTTQAASRCGTGGTGNRVDFYMLVWPSGEAECAAALLSPVRCAQD